MKNRQAAQNRRTQKGQLRQGLILLTLFALLLLFFFSAEADILTDAERYDAALMQLNAYLRQSRDTDLDGAVEAFQELRGYADANGFRGYAEVIREIDSADGSLETARSYVEMLKKNTDLQERLADEAFRAQYPYIRSGE